MNFTTGARFSKVQELYGPFSDVKIPSVSQERRGFESSNFTVILLFVTLKTRSAFLNKQLTGSQMVFRAGNVFGTFEKRAPDILFFRESVKR